MILYQEQRIINASVQKVFDVIVDYSSYSLWNRWIHFAEENLDGTVTVKTTINGKEKTFQHKIIEVSPHHTFHWCDMGWFTLFAFGQRLRNIEALSEHQCRYVCELRVTGLANKLADITHGRFMREGLTKEADSLKAYVEALVF